MRWDNLRIDAEEESRLPRFSEPAVVRTFDAPEALGTRFYEVRARSGINAVPKRSRMPFRFTINPYRGCAHACAYCLDGETPILMTDGRTKPLAELRPRDSIYGTIRAGAYRRYVPTRVLAHWATFRDAYRITLEDGTELIASGDHRFLTDRGWKFVTGEQQGQRRRPHLTTNNKLMGTGGFAQPPTASTDYRLGYVSGIVRGDGNLGSYRYERAGRATGDVHRFRLALTDIEALRRAREYLAALDVQTDEFQFAAGSTDHRPMMAIRTSARLRVERIRELIAWPRGRAATDDWCKGFLAGIFDAEGTASAVVRIANCDDSILDWTAWCLRRFDFDFALEDRGQENRLRIIRLTGGLPERLRFLHLTDPAITRKRSIVGAALKSNAPLGIESIEPLQGGRRMFDITTGTGDFIANGVVSHNCFARPTHTYLDFNAREDFEREIVVKVNVPELVRAELGCPSWGGDHVALGTNTDPYQWVEGRYRLMEGIWEAMRDHANPCSVLTKSSLLLRDIDLFRELCEVTSFSTALSIPTIDEKAWRETEPHTPHPRKRLEAIAELTRNGIPCSVLVAPLIPGVNDDPGQVEEILRVAGENGAGNVTGIGLHLRGEVREIFMDWLRQYRPDLIPRYEELYRRGAYLPSEERKRLGALTAGFRRKRGAPRPGGFGGRGISREEAEAKSPPRKPRQAQQASLF